VTEGGIESEDGSIIVRAVTGTVLQHSLQLVKRVILDKVLVIIKPDPLQDKNTETL
jgi:hypothetical protein